MSDNSSSSDSNEDSSSSDREAARVAQELLHDQSQLVISMQAQIARLKTAAATAVQLRQARVARNRATRLAARPAVIGSGTGSGTGSGGSSSSSSSSSGGSVGGGAGLTLPSGGFTVSSM